MFDKKKVIGVGLAAIAACSMLVTTDVNAATIAHRWSFNDGGKYEPATDSINGIQLSDYRGGWYQSGGRLRAKAAKSEMNEHNLQKYANDDALYADSESTNLIAETVEGQAKTGAVTFEFWFTSTKKNKFSNLMTLGHGWNEKWGDSKIEIMPRGAGDRLEVQYLMAGYYPVSLRTDFEIQPYMTYYLAVTIDDKNDKITAFIRDKNSDEMNEYSTGEDNTPVGPLSSLNIIGDEPGGMGNYFALGAKVFETIPEGEELWKNQDFEGEYREFRIWTGKFEKGDAEEHWTLGENEIPEPSTAALAGLSLCFLASRRRK